MDGARPFSCPAHSRLEEREAEERRERAEEEERARREAELEEATPRPNNGEARRDTLECIKWVFIRWRVFFFFRT